MRIKCINMSTRNTRQGTVILNFSEIQNAEYNTELREREINSLLLPGVVQQIILNFKYRI